jgi:hypothetical protein
MLFRYVLHDVIRVEENAREWIITWDKRHVQFLSKALYPAMLVQR